MENSPDSLIRNIECLTKVISCLQSCLADKVIEAEQKGVSTDSLSIYTYFMNIRNCKKKIGGMVIGTLYV